MEKLNRQQLDSRMQANDNALLVNVLPKESFSQEHIPGSINIPVGEDDFVDKVARKAGDKSREIIVYCASAECTASDQAAEALEQAGFTNVEDFAGGMAEWKNSGGTIQSI